MEKIKYHNISDAISINQSINVYLYSPISQMLHLSQWTSQFVQNISMTIRHPILYSLMFYYLNIYIIGLTIV